MGHNNYILFTLIMFLGWTNLFGQRGSFRPLPSLTGTSTIIVGTNLQPFITTLPSTSFDPLPSLTTDVINNHVYMPHNEIGGSVSPLFASEEGGGSGGGGMEPDKELKPKSVIVKPVSSNAPTANGGPPPEVNRVGDDGGGGDDDDDEPNESSPFGQLLPYIIGVWCLSGFWFPSFRL